MIFLYIIATVIMLGVIAGGGAKVNRLHAVKTTYGIPNKELQTFSWPSQAILKEYRALPVGNQFGNIESILRALDVSAGIENANKHFMKKTHGYDSMGYRTTNWKHAWSCECYNVGSCDFEKYWSLHNEIKGIKKDLAEQEYALQLAGVSHELSLADTLIENMRKDRGIIRDVTKKTVKELA